MAVGNEGLEITGEVAQQGFRHGFPDVFLRRLWRKENHPLTMVRDHPLNEHESDVGFTQPDAVTKKRSPVTRRDLDEVLVGIPLVTRQFGEDD